MRYPRESRCHQKQSQAAPDSQWSLTSYLPKGGAVVQVEGTGVEGESRDSRGVREGEGWRERGRRRSGEEEGGMAKVEFRERGHSCRGRFSQL